MNLADIPLEELHRGQQVLHPDTLRPSQVITVRLELLADAKPLKEQTRIRFHHLSAELLGTIRFVDDTDRRAAARRQRVRADPPRVAGRRRRGRSLRHPPLLARVHDRRRRDPRRAPREAEPRHAPRRSWRRSRTARCRSASS